MTDAVTSNNAHAVVDADLAERLATQDWRRTAHYGIAATVVSAGTTQQVTFDITQEASFLCEILTGKIVPTNAATNTGLLLQLFDNNTELTDGFIPLENILSPGYGAQLFYPHKLSYIFEKNNKVRCNIQNISAEDQTVSLTFSGEKLI
jgi:hypothetical protein